MPSFRSSCLYLSLLLALIGYCCSSPTRHVTPREAGSGLEATTLDTAGEQLQSATCELGVGLRVLQVFTTQQLFSVGLATEHCTDCSDFQSLLILQQQMYTFIQLLSLQYTSDVAINNTSAFKVQGLAAIMEKVISDSCNWIVARQISIGQQPTLNCSSTDDESSAISRNNSDEILFTALALGLKCTVNQAFNFIAGGIGPASCPNLDRPAWLNEVWENNPQICPSDQSDFCTFLKMEC